MLHHQIRLARARPVLETGTMTSLTPPVTVSPRLLEREGDRAIASKRKAGGP